MPPVLRLISASRSPPATPCRSAATVAAALAPDPAGSPTAAAAAPAAAAATPAAALLLPPALVRRFEVRFRVMSVECSRPLAMVQALTLPSVEMETSSSSRSGPRSSQRTCSHFKFESCVTAVRAACYIDLAGCMDAAGQTVGRVPPVTADRGKCRKVLHTARCKLAGSRLYPPCMQLLAEEEELPRQDTAADAVRKQGSQHRVMAVASAPSRQGRRACQCLLC